MKLPKPVSGVSLAVTNAENNNNSNPLIHILGGMNNERTQENTHLAFRVQEILGSTVFEKEWSSGHIGVKKRLEREFDIDTRTDSLSVEKPPNKRSRVE